MITRFWPTSWQPSCWTILCQPPRRVPPPFWRLRRLARRARSAVLEGRAVLYSGSELAVSKLPQPNVARVEAPGALVVDQSGAAAPAPDLEITEQTQCHEAVRLKVERRAQLPARLCAVASLLEGRSLKPAGLE